MKKPIITTLSAVVLASSALAGDTMMHSSKETHAPVKSCFADREWQVDLFGVYGFTSSSQDQLLGDHAWGGGLGLNYFFQRNLGVGIEGILYDTTGDALGSAALNVFLRFPMDSSCLAPYIYGGVGGVFNAEDRDKTLPGADKGDDALLAGHVGVGLEYRVRPNIGLFIDGRYTFVDKDHNDFATVRTGLRFAF